MAKPINTAKAREALKPKREPYWHPIRRGCWLGFRKMSATGEGVWRARYRESGSTTRSEQSLGDFGYLPPGDRYDAALKAAEDWFRHMGAGGRNEPETVEAVCKAYVQHTKDEGREATAKDAEGRFKRWVYGKAFGKLDIQKMTHPKVMEWRKTLAKTQTLPRDKAKKGERKDRTPASLNRDISTLRAALNLALTDRKVTTDGAWKVALKPLKAASARRDIYLTPEQRKALVEAAQADMRPFLQALCLLPVRSGPMSKLVARDFDRRLSVLHIRDDKTGKSRQVKLPAIHAAFFTEQVKDKLPAVPIFHRADGVAWNKDSWKEPMREAVTAAKLPEGTIAYTLRHSTITDLVARHGLDLMTVAILADTSIAMIQKHYGHLIEGYAAEALSKLAI